MVEFRVRLPAPSSMAAANLLGLLGLLGVAVCLGGLTSWWVAGLVASAEAVGLAYVASLHAAQRSPAAEPAPAPARPVPPARGVRPA